MSHELDKTSSQNNKSDVEAFLRKVSVTPVRTTGGANGRLIFAIDATASRQPTWDHAAHLQREMFDAAAETGKLELQIAFFRGFGEFKATPWTTDSRALVRPMSRVTCLGGHTQIGKVLKHTLRQNDQQKVNAVVYVGDCMEEDADHLCHLAGKLGLNNVPVFIFQEGYEPTAETCFRQITKLTGGAYCRFDMNSATTLRNLLKAVAVYATGGRKALENYSNKAAREVLLLAKQIK
ncbi:VWA domain-containing protein [Sneathiella chinensis]|uniref:VWA domain-containing protein n=1 Tax=Sneathiella chinensis TaxID=349750 RepID=A0ABQ5U8Q0_9PROT|nr:VWA domain-containing protein [Sneathiella chinensis]GLQ07707.1 hypothetical protein GCM10007924_29280 [Sneathiella chinensis]